MQRTIIAKRAAVDLIERLGEELGARSDFRRVVAWRYSESGSDEDRHTLRADGELAAELGIAVDFLDAAELPFATRFACRFARQAAFHPMHYLAALARFVRDCPCHGSIFSCGGEVVAGPAARGLAEAPAVAPQAGDPHQRI